ncbi:hypothetical protein FXB42_12070 [Acetobacterium wieringae]|uniref:Uncharacterized protein n=1 Tax=Acetobacterium wieringae TaxID=52694 RepID=A0A5D0WJL1_9FIRM|nr:hypothetical protein [Acetobacterium wieringae]TYC84495.1 hypothetical protein FXB42_12070 [Acetobacterium wieringae]
MKKKKVIMIISGILVVLAVVIAIKFNLELKKASARFETYQNKVETIETSYGRIVYIDEGEGEVILSCHDICGYDQAYDTLADKTDDYREKKYVSMAVLATISLSSMLIGAIGTGLVPIDYFGVTERFSVFAATAFTAILGLYVFYGIDYLEKKV